LERGRVWEKRWSEGNSAEGLGGMDGKTKGKRKEANKEKGSGKNSGVKGIRRRALPGGTEGLCVFG